MGETAQLHDPGEEKWKKKLHLGCGSVYLEGYVNIDAAGELASERPDLVRANLATIGDYYAQKAAYTDVHHIAPRGEYVVDLKADMADLYDRFARGSVDKIVCVQALEHLRPKAEEHALLCWRSLLRRDGVLVLSVPDTGPTVEMLLDEETRDFAIRHLAGTRKDKWSYHYNWFTPQNLELLLWSLNFHVEFLENFHRYPAIVVRALKENH